MNRRDWERAGWVWVTGLTILGLILLIAARFRIDETFAFDAGLGTALSLVAAGILFAAVIPALGTSDNRLVPVATVLTAMFGYGGTLIILFDEDPILLAIVLSYTFYLALLAFMLVGIVWLICSIFAKLRS